ncbi:hypothetical protein D3C85_1696410 [compost metagenome]
MAAAMDVQLVLRLLHAEFIEEHVRHVGVEVLAGMHQHFGQPRVPGHCRRHDAGFDELGAGPQDGQNLPGHS